MPMTEGSPIKSLYGDLNVFLRIIVGRCILPPALPAARGPARAAPTVLIIIPCMRI